MKSSDTNPDWKNRLEGHAMQSVPEGLLWENSGDELMTKLTERQKRKRKFFVWWWLGGISLLLLASISTWAILERFSTPTAKTEITAPKNHTPTKSVIQNSTAPKISKDSFKVTTIKQERINPHLPNKTNPSFQRQSPLAKDSSTIVPEQEVTSHVDGQFPQFLSQQQSFILSPLADRDRYALSERQPSLYPSLSPNASSTSRRFLVYGGFHNWSQQYNFAQTPNLQVSEFSLTGWQSGLRWLAPSKTGWSYQVGIEFQQLRYRFETQVQEDIRLYQPGTVVEILVNTFTDDSTFTTTDTIPGIRSTYIRNYNEINTASLLGLVGYQWAAGRWNIGLHFGPRLQFYQTARGLTAFEELNLIDLENEELYKNGTQWSLMAEIDLTYQIGARWSIWSGIGYQHSLSNWVNKDFGFSQRPILYQVSFGLIREF